MPSTADSPERYLQELPADRREAVSALREVILKNIPKGFQEVMTYGMLGYVVPHSIYPAGYHCNPKQPLPFVAIASQKNYISFHHIGLYGDSALLKWFTDAYAAHAATKLDMGKGCVRFKKPDQIPFELIGKLMKKITVQDWISHYEKTMKR